MLFFFFVLNCKLGTKSFVLDCEAVAYDPAEDKILPFQILSTRAKKSVELSQVRVKYVQTAPCGSPDSI